MTGHPLVKHCMGLWAWGGADSGPRLFDPPGGVRVRRIRADERDRFVALEVAAFGDDPATARAWLAHQFGVEAVHAGGGATLVHAYPDDDEEATAFAAVGFIEVPGVLVRLVQPA